MSGQTGTTASATPPDKPKRRESWWVIVGTGAGVIAAFAAVAVFIVPTADWRLDHHESIGTASTPRGQGGSAPATTPSSEVLETRYLTDLQPAAGTGFLSRSGHDLRVSCPTNNSDDTLREISYDLPATFRSFSAQVGVSGKADADATASVRLFINHRVDRTDRTDETGRRVVTANTPGPLSADLSGAVAFTLRITCSASTQTITLTAPHIIR